MTPRLAVIVSGTGCLAVLVGLRAAVRASGRAAVTVRLGGCAPVEVSTRRRRTLPAAPLAVRAALADCGLGADADALWWAWLVGVVAAVAGASVTAGIGLGVVVAVASVAVPLVAARLLRGRASRAYEAALPGGLEAVARALRSGASLRQAVAEAGTATAGPLGGDLTDVAAAASAGVSVVAALGDWARRRPRPVVRLAVSALCLGAETGGAQARAVDGLAATIRDRLAVAGEVRALASQARASAAVLVVAPIAFCAFAATVDHRTATFLFRQPAGLAVLLAGLLLDLVAALWMARLTRMAT